MGRKKIKKKIVVPPMPFKKFEKSFRVVGSFKPTVEDGVKTYRGVVFVEHTRIPVYQVDLFNAVLPVMQVDVKNNIIKIWESHGPKTKVYDNPDEDEHEANREYHWENQWWTIKPTYSIKGWLSELPDPDSF